MPVAEPKITYINMVMSSSGSWPANWKKRRCKAKDASTLQYSLSYASMTFCRECPALLPMESLR